MANGKFKSSNGGSNEDKSSASTNAFSTESSSDSETERTEESDQSRVRNLEYPRCTVNGYQRDKSCDRLSNVSKVEPKIDLKCSNVFNSHSPSNDHGVIMRKKTSVPSPVGRTEPKPVIPKVRPNSVGTFHDQMGFLRAQ